MTSFSFDVLSSRVQVLCMMVSRVLMFISSQASPLLSVIFSPIIFCELGMSWAADSSAKVWVMLSSALVMR